MPKSQSSRPAPHSSSAAVAATPETAARLLEASCSKADAMFRTAVECCRQHVRYARLVEHDACESEQRVACQAAGVYDDLLRDTMEAYARSVPSRGSAPRNGNGAHHGNGGNDTYHGAYHGAPHEGADSPGQPEWWHRANMLLLASREYLRHRDRCDGAARGMSRHTVDDLDALSAEYELGASALLGLQQALDGYRKARPEAEFKGNGRPKAD